MLNAGWSILYTKELASLLECHLCRRGALAIYPFFAPSVYDYIIGKDICTIHPDVAEIPDVDVKSCVVKVYIYYMHFVSVGMTIVYYHTDH